MLLEKIIEKDIKILGDSIMVSTHGLYPWNGGSIPSLPTTLEYSSVGSEHLPYKQGVVGSNPTAPTNKKRREVHHSSLLITVL